jgi:transglutaminase/protease-like cytokinesis protein 3
MKIPLVLSLFLCSFIISKAQETDFTTIDTWILRMPDSASLSTTSIANYIQSHYKTEKEKLYAAYSWVTYNIKYDTDSMYIINSGKDSSERISGALRRRKGVCENFAAIFNDVAVKCGIRSLEIDGYTKQSGRVDRTAHTWCAVYIDGDWSFCDPTWDIGFSRLPKYFMVSPDVFIESHMPFDPLWQLLDYTVSHREFSDGNIHHSNNTPVVHFKDSADAYLKLNNLEKFETSLSRIKAAGIANEMVRTRILYLQMQVGVIHQDKDLNNYNDAVNNLNAAKNIYNNFIQYRNNRFLPRKTDIEIRKILPAAEAFIDAAYEKVKVLDISPSNFQYDTGSLKNRLDELKDKIRIQKDFLQRYLEAAVNDREKLFYK